MTAPGLGADTALLATEKGQQRSKEAELPRANHLALPFKKQEDCTGLMHLGDIPKTSEVIPPKDLVPTRM